MAFQFFARDCGAPTHAPSLEACKAIGLVGLVDRDVTDDALVQLAFEGGRLVIGPPRPIAALDPDRYDGIGRLALKEASEILRMRWWEASNSGVVEGAAILRPTVVQGVAMLVGALSAPAHAPLPFELERLTTCAPDGTPLHARAIESKGTNLQQILRMPVWGEPAFGLGSTYHPKAAREAAEVQRQAIAIAANGGGKPELLAFCRATSNHSHFWSLCVSSIAEDPIYRATIVRLARAGEPLTGFDGIVTAADAHRRDTAMRDAIRAVLAEA